MRVHAAAEVHLVGKHHSADFQEQNPVNRYQQKCTQTEANALFNLEVDFGELVEEIGTNALFQRPDHDVGEGDQKIEKLQPKQNRQQIVKEEHQNGWDDL